MKILALDTATERCSVALLADGRFVERAVETQRGHAEMILPMIAEVLREAGISLRELDAIAYGRGPGAFTGVRIAIGVVQGLAFGAGIATVGVSDLAAVAQQAGAPAQEILVCTDARMGEVYWARYILDPDTRLVRAITGERVDRPERVEAGRATVFAGTGFRAYPQLAGASAAAVHDALLPRAREIALLAEPEVRAGRGMPAGSAAPVYLRDKVVQ